MPRVPARTGARRNTGGVQMEHAGAPSALHAVPASPTSRCVPCQLCRLAVLYGGPTLPRGTPPDTDGESMTPEPQRSSTSAPDGLRVVYDLIGEDPNASFAAYDLFIG